jgi:glycosyltransferase involved in cell wall biosynthesis
MISVCLASFNGECYIEDQIKSILYQLDKSDELIISDDGSSDMTCAIVNNIKDDRIKLIDGPGEGVIKNFEKALNLSNGDYIFLCDQDDLWLENKVYNSINEILKGNILVVTDATLIDDTGEVITSSFFDVNNTKEGFFHNYIKNGYLGCCMAFHRKLIPVVLPFPVNVGMHDIWIGSISSIVGNVSFLKKALVSYRRHPATTTITGQKSSSSLMNKFKWRFYLLYHLAIRTNLFSRRIVL